MLLVLSWSSLALSLVGFRGEGLMFGNCRVSHGAELFREVSNSVQTLFQSLECVGLLCFDLKLLLVRILLAAIKALLDLFDAEDIRDLKIL